MPPRRILLITLACLAVDAPAYARPAPPDVPLISAAQQRAMAQGRLILPVDRGCVGLHVRPVAGSPYRRQRPRTGTGRVGTAFCGGPVRRVRPGWVQATLAAYRPGAPDVTGWAQAAATELRVVPYTVVVRRERREVLVRAGRRLVRRFGVGVGAAATPTTLGTTYVTARLRYRPDRLGYAAYGPHVLALGLPASDGPGQNPVFRGQGVLALHAGSPRGSHGCIHVGARDMAWMWDHVPAGTRVRVAR